MLIGTEKLSQTTDTVARAGSWAMDTTLAALRISGTVLINEAYAAPWSVLVPSHERLAHLVGATPAARTIAFHLVRRGAFELHCSGQPKRQVRAGEGVFVVSGAEHRLVEGRATRSTPLQELLRPHRAQPEAAASTGLICGVFVMHDVRFNPLFSALPPVLGLSFEGPTSSYFLRGTADLLVAELAPGGAARSWVVSRLLELLCGEAIVAEAGNGRGWLSAVKDSSVGSALGAFHREPGAAWSVDRLAKYARLSPSRFSARFRELLEESPMEYATRWRMACAARLLRDTADRVEEVGRAVGYQSLPAFSRAFKRQWGMAPRDARKRPDSASGR